jgi:hypothetical protein
LITALDPLFIAEDAPAFTERHIASLAAGTLAAVRIPALLFQLRDALLADGYDLQWEDPTIRKPSGPFGTGGLRRGRPKRGGGQRPEFAGAWRTLTYWAMQPVLSGL